MPRVCLCNDGAVAHIHTLPPKSMYVWNTALVDELQDLVAPCWTLPLVYGSFEQVRGARLSRHCKLPRTDTASGSARAMCLRQRALCLVACSRSRSSDDGRDCSLALGT